MSSQRTSAGADWSCRRRLCSLVFEAVPFHGATGVVVIDIGALRTEVEISAPVARTVDIGFFHGGADR
jgi:hypothetical protein